MSNLFLWSRPTVLMLSDPDSKFGQAFQAAAELSNARARHDRFEESACEVRKDDLMAFVEKLHLAL